MGLLFSLHCKSGVCNLVSPPLPQHEQPLNECSAALLAQTSPFLTLSCCRRAGCPRRAPRCPGVLPRCGAGAAIPPGRGWHRHTLLCCQASAGNLVLPISALLSASQGKSLIWKHSRCWQVFIPSMVNVQIRLSVNVSASWVAF